MTKGENNKKKIMKINLFLLLPLPSQDGGGGGLLQPSLPSTFFMAKIFEIFFTQIHGYLDKGWINWPNGNLSKNAETARGKIRKGGCNNPRPPPPSLPPESSLQSLNYFLRGLTSEGPLREGNKAFALGDFSFPIRSINNFFT